MMDAGRHPGIEILTRSELVALSGEPGRWRATLRRHFTGVDATRCTGCGDCAAACPVAAPNPFDVGLGVRKAIFRPFPQAVPAVYAIDPEICLNQGDWIACERCRVACPREAIDLERREREEIREAGALIVATGFEEFDPSGLRHYGYGHYPDVVTSLELERLLNASGPTLGHVVRPSDGKPPRRIVYVQCVGARGEAGRAHCSRYCCMNAVKDALLLKQHDPSVEEVTILYTDLRAFGKGFEDLRRRAEAQPHVRFQRGRPAKVLPRQASGDLEIWVEDTERGRPQRLTADLVVLSCAGAPAEGAARLAERLGVATTPLGFIAVDPARGAVRTSREGIFVCGGASGPQVIPDCVAQASAAALEAARCVRGAGAKGEATEAPGEDSRPAADLPMEAPGLETIDLAALLGPEALDREPAASRPLVANEMTEVAEALAAGSWRDRLGVRGPADREGATRIAREAGAAAPGSPALPAGAPPESIGARGTTVSAPPEAAASGSPGPTGSPAGAAPRVGVFLCHCGINIAGVLDLPALRDYAARLPGVAHVGEELFACSAGAQEAIRAAVAEQGLDRVVVAACTPRTHEPIFRQNCQAAGLNPYLLEMANIRDQCSWVHAQAPREATEKARDLLRMAVARARHLAPLEPTEVEVTRRVLVVGGGLPGMKAASDLAALGFEVLLVEQADTLGGLVAELHSLYPDRRSADRAVAELSERLATSPVAVKRGIRLARVEGYVGNFRVALAPAGAGAEEAPRCVEEQVVGAILLATGAAPYAPADGELGYRAYSNVVTSLELEECLRDPGTRLAGVRTVGFVQCVGSRLAAEDPGSARGQTGCSRICCPTTIKQALELHDLGIDSVVLYRDLRAVGPGMEELYREARGRGTLFLRLPERGEPRLEAQGDRLAAVVVEDALAGAEVRVPVDLLVLAIGLVPRAEETRRLQELLKTPRGPDGFFLERHPELGPVETCVDGVYVCGAAQGPKELPEALAQASAAAMKAAALLGAGRLALDPAVCRVTADLCRGCGLCVSLCEFQAPRLIEGPGGTRAAVINAALCKGCGTCAVWCPTGAIQALHFTDTQITSMIDSLFRAEASR